MTSQNIYSVFIVEDEFPAREKLMEYIMTREELKLAGFAKNGTVAVEKLSTEKYDLLFLDIHLPDMTGIEMLEKLEERPRVIFTTAYDRYAIKAFDLEAADYLLKPFSLDRFNDAVDKFIKSQEQQSHKKPGPMGLSFREEGVHYLLPYNDIIYLSSHGKHTIIHTEERDFETASLLKDVEEKLPGDKFRRIHKQHVVNIGFISNIKYYMGGQYQAFLKDRDETALTITRTYIDDIKQVLDIK